MDTPASDLPCWHLFTNESGTVMFKYCPMCGVLTETITGYRQ